MNLQNIKVPKAKERSSALESALVDSSGVFYQQHSIRAWVEVAIFIFICFISIIAVIGGICVTFNIGGWCSGVEELNRLYFGVTQIAVGLIALFTLIKRWFVLSIISVLLLAMWGGKGVIAEAIKAFS